MERKINNNLERKIREVKRLGRLSTALTIVGCCTLYSGLIGFVTNYVTKSRGSYLLQEITRDYDNGIIISENRNYTAEKIREFVDERTKTSWSDFVYPACVIPLGIYGWRKANKTLRVWEER